MSLSTSQESVLLNCGWQELPSQFTSLTVNTDGDDSSPSDDKKVRCPMGQQRPDQPNKCTFTLETTSFYDSPHRHMSRVEQPAKLKILPNILHHIGNTPLVRINKIGKSVGLQCEILAKCEFFNAGGSVKDRIALRMIEDAEAAGLLRPGDTLIEPTSGNTGIGLALAAAVKGYRCVIVMPEKMSKEKVDTLSALGAEIIRTPTGASIDSPESHISVAYRLLNEIPRSHILNQYSNPGNPLAHYEATAEEILEACDGRVDMFVAGAGTGGTLTGVAMKLRQRCPNCKIVGIDPLGSTISSFLDVNKSDVTLFEVEGIGYDFVPAVSNGEYVDRWYKSEDKPTFQMARRLIKEEGLLCGGSSGAAMYCALQAAKDFNMTSADYRIVVVLPDSIRNYMTRYLSDDWMLERKYIDPADISPDSSWWANYPVSALQLKAPLTIHPSVTVHDALELLDREGFDQVPVVDDFGEVIGMLTLGNMMSLLTKGRIRLADSVGSVSYKRFRKVALDTNLGSLSVLLNIDHYVVVVVNQRQCRENKVTTKSVICGIVTRINLFEFIMKGHDMSMSAPVVTATVH